MAKQRVMFTFTPETIAEPIIYNLGQQFNVITNIFQAELNLDKGWIELELNGEVQNIEAVISWVTSRGVKVDLISDETTGI
ncbi:NIL domain-containing protein [Chloroflexota bacterium]